MKLETTPIKYEFLAYIENDVVKLEPKSVKVLERLNSDYHVIEFEALDHTQALQYANEYFDNLKNESQT